MPTGAGFVVKVRARLLFGRDRADAVKWLMQGYYENLREQGRRAGLGFFIPPDDPKDPTKNAISDPSPTPYYQTASFGQGLAPPAGDAKTAVQIPDPITGEECATDWLVDFSFKVQLGAMPEPAAQATAEGQPAAGPQPAGGGGQPPAGLPAGGLHRGRR
jgi:hypothetical protein